VNDTEASVQQALARNCADLLAALPADSRVALFCQMSTVVTASGCAWRIRLALADQLGTIALLFDIAVTILPPLNVFWSVCVII
jgi:hypothetical protein